MSVPWGGLEPPFSFSWSGGALPARADGVSVVSMWRTAPYLLVLRVFFNLTRVLDSTRYFFHVDQHGHVFPSDSLTSRGVVVGYRWLVVFRCWG